MGRSSVFGAYRYTNIMHVPWEKMRIQASAQEFILRAILKIRYEVLVKMQRFVVRCLIIIILFIDMLWLLTVDSRRTASPTGMCKQGRQ